jgi:hypothetical protein
MKKTLLLFVVCSLPLLGIAQSEVKRAYLGTDGEVLVETLQVDESFVNPEQGSKYSQLPGWPKKIANHPNFKTSGV